MGFFDHTLLDSCELSRLYFLEYVSIDINVDEYGIVGLIVELMVMLLLCRSTPCPSVKHGDEWGDPSQCDNGDDCTYCHTRTEQQFHPEV